MKEYWIRYNKKQVKLTEKLFNKLVQEVWDSGDMCFSPNITFTRKGDSNDMVNKR